IFGTAKKQLASSPLLLLLRVNAVHSWRRLLAIRQQSRLLTGIIAIFVAGYLVLAFELFFHGMRFIAKFPGLGAVLTERLLYTLFAFLFALLLLSNLVIAYTNLFRNRETAFLLTLPVPAQNIFNWKFIESTILALLFAVPLAIGTAVFLTEMCPPRLRGPLAFLTELLAAIPSVIYGLWAGFVLVPILREN